MNPELGAVAVVVDNHNTRDDLLACLGSLADAGAGAGEVVVVDSGSDDGSLDAVARAYPRVRRIGLANVGFGRAANAGVAATRTAAVVVANADTRFRPDAPLALAGYLGAHPDVGAAGPLVRFPDGRLQLSARAFPSLGQAVGHALLGLWRPDNRWTRAYRLTDWDHASERDVDWLSGCCLALRREAFEDVGGFDPAYFMFVEDVDLCYRLRQAGWRVVFAPVTEVVHAVGTAVSRRRFRMVVEHARSLDRFFARRYASGPRRLLRPLIRLGLSGWVLAAMAWAALRGRTHAHA
ncbi:MAG TPA: glycosyltransferase family 2 protein [Egibacteraceae bacterium]|nr:glycosyltransferase family 2 protein [Egibacteraceae bacterium]